MLLGPFTQLLTMDAMPSAGPLQDEQLEIIPEGGVRVDGGVITEIGIYREMRRPSDVPTEGLPAHCVALPAFIDAHTHICFAGSRARDYALRVSGVTYQQIAAAGGGILDTVKQTRKASKDQLVSLLIARTETLLKQGVATCEVKSGYGLTVDDEVKQLEAIRQAAGLCPIDLVPTCLAAHTRPPEFTSNCEYLQFLVENLFPVLKERRLTNRIDIFVDDHAFTCEEARTYLQAAKAAGFSICVHADQFDSRGSELAAEVKALSADHLEHTDKKGAVALKKGGVIPVVLPGATLGLGTPFPPARMLLDEGLPLAIASDWNPGSAPMGYLLAQAAFLGAAQKLTMAETLAAITIRAAGALGLSDRGVLKVGRLADIAVYDGSDYRDILYHQGAKLPKLMFKRGASVCS